MEIEHSIKEYLVMLRALKDAGLTCIIMINRFCSHCGSNTGYDRTKESSSHWCSLVTRDNKRCLYFLCSSCYAKQTDKNPKWNPIINAKWQNGKELQHKTNEISIIIRS
jgi:hypothetical protein